MESESHNEAVSSDVTLDFNFVPKWAREVPGRNPYAHFEGRGGREERRDRGRGRPPGGPGPRPRPARPAPSREMRGDRRGPGAYPQGERRFDRHATGQAPEPELKIPVSVGFIPERTRLGLVVRELRGSGRAYPLVKLAYGFLSHAGHYRIKIECRPPRDRSEPVHLFQCRQCGAVFMEEASALAHAPAAHLDTRFEREDRDVEPPSGAFVCVARCRLSGEILGPPNYHGYNERLMELHRARFSHLPLDEYRKQIETIRDPDLIERWKQQCCRQTLYRLKNDGGDETYSRRDAEKLFAEKYAAPLVVRVRKAVLAPETASQLEDGPLKQAVRDAWTRESRRPFTLMLALRPAFHHMRLHVFRTRGGTVFVSAVAPHPMDSAHAIRPISEMLDLLRERPGCTRRQLVEKLRPGEPPDSPVVSEVLHSLRWLIEKGHVIEFFDGTLSIPSAGGKKEAGRAPDRQ